MGVVKKIGKAVSKAERAYEKAKEDSAPIRKTGMKILDWALPPPKKKAGGRSRTKSVKMGGCSCKCPK